MTFDEADAVMAELVLNFPRHGLTDEAMAAWAEAICDSGAEPVKAMEVAHRWARTHEWFPSLAEFLSVVAPRVQVAEVEDPDEWRASPVVARKMVALWREELAKVDKRRANLGPTRGLDGHWHGGPEPCPVCGGMKAFR